MAPIHILSFVICSSHFFKFVFARTLIRDNRKAWQGHESVKRGCVMIFDVKDFKQELTIGVSEQSTDMPLTSLFWLFVKCSVLAILCHKFSLMPAGNLLEKC